MCKEESQVHGGVVRAFLLKKKNCVEGSEAYLVRDEVSVSQEQMAKAAERVEAALTLQEFFRGVLAELREGIGMASLAAYVRERICVDDIHVCDGDLRMVFGES